MLKKQIRQNADPSIKPFRISNSALSLSVTAIAIVIYVSFIAVLLPLTNNNLYGLYGFSQELTMPDLAIVHGGSMSTPNLATTASSISGWPLTHLPTKGKPLGSTWMRL